MVINMTKYDLKDEELDEVSGGGILLEKGSCLSFMPASGKENVNKCKNCFYYHLINGTYKCDSPQKNTKGLI